MLDPLARFRLDARVAVVRASSTHTSTAGFIWCEHLGGRWVSRG